MRAAALAIVCLACGAGYWLGIMALHAAVLWMNANGL